jgi:endonuclease/exonuclease/phosphatase family metal-dependent hydrolase
VGVVAALASLGLLAVPATAGALPHRVTAATTSVSQRPVRPTQMRAATRLAGSYLSWQAKNATGFVVTRATNAAMTQGLHSYRIHGSSDQFTPPGLVRGRTYYFQVRALHGSARSAPSAVQRLVSAAPKQQVSVMTYNLLEAWLDGSREGSGRVAPWSERKVGAVDLINSAHPDVIGIQEGAAWVGKVRGPRQVDSLRSALGSPWVLAHTEIPPSQPHYFRTGCYILYNKTEYRAVGHGGHWGLGSNRWAAYQVLANRATGARFLFVVPHLIVTKGDHYDALREAETRKLLADGQHRAAAAGLPVVYAGDYNSDVSPQHAFDGPRRAMRAAHFVNDYTVAQHRVRARYNSANQYERVPPKTGDHIDAVYTGPGVAVNSWREILRLSHGRIVGVIPSDHNPLVISLSYPY